MGMIGQTISDRYDLLGTLGEGGMGVVYRAFDKAIRREVALKTIRDTPSQTALGLFRKECSVLAAMSHPNIVEIFDVGEFEEGGTRKPYFVMPLLRGDTLAQVLRSSGLTLDRTLEIILQICRGLHAAHEQGLIHRDLKPNNIFVLPDDSVKVIDFGVAHMADAGATMTIKGGTLLYMSPEQVEMKPVTPSSDIFALGVLFYEMVTGRRPFNFASEQEIAQAILRFIPPPASEVNPSVPSIYSRMIHKAMAKQPWNRFSTAREFAETIQKALRNEPIELFDPSRLKPRLERATKALEQGNFQFASEILGELEAGGDMDSSISQLRRQIDEAAREKAISELIERARACMEADEFLLSLQKIQDVLQLDPQNAAALALRITLAERRNEAKVQEWLQSAHRHLENHAFGPAREALDNILKLRPGDSPATEMLGEIERLEQQYVNTKNEKQALYQSALAAWKNGGISAALANLESLLALDRNHPDRADTASRASYQSFYEEVRSERDRKIGALIAECLRLHGEGNVQGAVVLIDQGLVAYPAETRLQELSAALRAPARTAFANLPPAPAAPAPNSRALAAVASAEGAPVPHEIAKPKASPARAAPVRVCRRVPVWIAAPLAGVALLVLLWFVRLHRTAPVSKPEVAVSKTEAPAGKSEVPSVTVQPADLSIKGAPAGAEVRLDQSRIGLVQPDGSFSYKNIPPGQHNIELRAEHYQPKRVQAAFQTGQTTAIQGADVALARASGSLQVDITPPNAIVTYARSGEPARRMDGANVKLEEDSYTLTAQAPGFEDQQAVVQVKSGAVAKATFRLVRRVTAPKTMTMDSWAQAGWTREDSWQVHRGGGFVAFPVRPVSGTFVFTAFRRSRLLGNTRISWFLNFTNERNYLLFGLDRKFLYGTEVAAGKHRDLAKQPVAGSGSGNDLQFTVRIDVAPDHITHFIQDGTKWTPVDMYSSHGEDLSRGNFGFYLPGTEELLISGFRFDAKP